MGRVGREGTKGNECDGSLFSLCDYSKTLLSFQPRIRQLLTNSPNRKAERIAWAPKENSGAIVAALWRKNALIKKKKKNTRMPYMQ